MQKRSENPLSVRMVMSFGLSGFIFKSLGSEFVINVELYWSLSYKMDETDLYEV